MTKTSEFEITTPTGIPMAFPQGIAYAELLEILKGHSETESGEWKLDRMIGGLRVDLAHARNGKVIEH
jgi:hypothetical protein